MLAAAFRIGKVAPTAFIRTFSSTRHVAAAPKRNPAQKYIATLRSGWHTPLWNLVDILREHREPEYIFDTLVANQLTVKEFRLWDQVLNQPNIAEAIVLLGDLGFKTKMPEDGEPPKTPIPSWLLLALATHHVRTSKHAAGPLVDLVFGYLDSQSPEVQGALLVLTAHHLAVHNLILPLKLIREAFLDTPHPEHTQQDQFNAFLKALSRMTSPSKESTRNVVSLLKAMDERSLDVYPNTYQVLLNKDFASLGLAQMLFVRVMKEKFKPSPALLETFLRVFSKHGKGDLALKFYEAIERVTKKANPNSTSREKIKTRQRARTSMLNYFDKRETAAKFIESIRHTPIPALPPTKSSRNEDDIDEGDPGLSVRQSKFEEISAFHIAAKDHSVPTLQLIRIFLDLSHDPTIVTYTIFVRGLMARGAYRLASIWWNKVAKQATLTMDRHALTVGVQALIRCGEPEMAFMRLEKYAKKLEPGMRRQLYTPAGTSIPVPLAPGENSIEMTTIAINEVLVAFNRISRPDVTFRLFTHMQVLYDTQPNEDTLSIVLQAARMAVRKDDSIRGVLERIKLLDPFRKVRANLRDVDTTVTERTQAVNDVIRCLGSPSLGLRRYMSSVWMGNDALEFGRKVFLQALFGHAAELSHSKPGLYNRLLTMQSPAAAVRPSYDATPPFLPSQPKPYVFVPPVDTPPPALPEYPAPPPKGSSYGDRIRHMQQMASYRAAAQATQKAMPPTPTSLHPTEFTLLTPSGHSYYPSIALTNNNFLNYIQLLCVGARVPEIPLALAWMRELGLKPSSSTLAAAMVCWSEVSQESPLMALWRKSDTMNDLEEQLKQIRAKLAQQNRELAAVKMLARKTRRRVTWAGAAQAKRELKEDPFKHNDRARNKGRLFGYRGRLLSRAKQGTWEFLTHQGEKYQGGQTGMEDLEEGGEYGRFVKWLRDWVGESRMPTAEGIRKWRMVVYRMRTSMAFDGSGDTVKEYEPMQDESMQDEPMQDEFMQDESMQDESMQDEWRTDEREQDELMQDELMQDEWGTDEREQNVSEEDKWAQRDDPRG